MSVFIEGCDARESRALAGPIDARVLQQSFCEFAETAEPPIEGRTALKAPAAGAYNHKNTPWLVQCTKILTDSHHGTVGVGPSNRLRNPLIFIDLYYLIKYFLIKAYFDV